VEKYFSRGRMAVVSGRLQMRKWTDKEGNKRTSAEIVADNVYFGDSKNAASDTAPNTYTATKPDFDVLDGDDVGLPF
jgi:single-strand DNA-binding protein